MASAGFIPEKSVTLNFDAIAHAGAEEINGVNCSCVHSTALVVANPIKTTASANGAENFIVIFVLLLR